ncbi:MAG: hypothetical protein OEX81_03095 [Candidatus Pacebacteria bacterium]|nr:hypothetical protein [Candidatus Paceibacterota bacterium]
MLQTTLAFGTQSANADTLSSLLLMGVKGMFLVGVLLYFIFAIIIVRQIHIMKKTLITPFSPVVLTIGYGHLIVVGLVGLLFLLIL